MATVNLGQAAIVSKGAYSAAASYAPLNLVTHNGGSYLCKRGCSNIEPGVLPTWQTYWVAATVGIRSFAKTGETADGMEYTATLSDNSTYVFTVKTAVDYPISVANGGTGKSWSAVQRQRRGWHGESRRQGRYGGEDRGQDGRRGPACRRHPLYEVRAFRRSGAAHLRRDDGAGRRARQRRGYLSHVFGVR